MHRQFSHTNPLRMPGSISESRDAKSTRDLDLLMGISIAGLIVLSFALAAIAWPSPPRAKAFAHFRAD